MAYKCTAVLSNDIGLRLVEAGLLPPNTRRFIIDCDTGKAAVVYYETFAEKQMLDIVFDALLAVKLEAPAQADSEQPVADPQELSRHFRDWADK